VTKNIPDAVLANQPPKKKRQSRRKEMNSQSDEYSGEYAARKKGRPRDVKRGGRKI
jgi:hypothetical protein